MTTLPIPPESYRFRHDGRTYRVSSVDYDTAGNVTDVRYRRTRKDGEDYARMREISAPSYLTHVWDFAAMAVRNMHSTSLAAAVELADGRTVCIPPSIDVEECRARMAWAERRNTIADGMNATAYRLLIETYESIAYPRCWWSFATAFKATFDNSAFASMAATLARRAYRSPNTSGLPPTAWVEPPFRLRSMGISVARALNVTSFLNEALNMRPGTERISSDDPYVRILSAWDHGKIRQRFPQTLGEVMTQWSEERIVDASDITLRHAIR